MYYLDFYGLYKQTEKTNRVIVRRSLKRDGVMANRLDRQHSMCFYCTKTITMKDHLDHIIPVYFGGDNKPKNLVAACRECNMAKMTDQIEITNPYTIKDYQKLQVAMAKWQKQIKKKPYLKRYQTKRVRLAMVYRADLFKSVKVLYEV